jgi:serine acetyltransferase
MKAKRLEDVYEATIAALSAPAGDALAKADAEGYPDYDEVVAWTERVKSVVLHQRDRGALRSELPALAERLLRFLARVHLPEGVIAEEIAAEFVARLPVIRGRLGEDLEAAFEGDPAAKSFAEILVAYPSIHAIAVYRMAHELVALGAPQIPRIMAEFAHDRTGIDIHPGARIGRRIFIDHGTGVVIGESAEIGDNARIYQGVTLGAFSPRRGQTIRGGETVIGRGSVISGNAVITESVPPGSRVVPEPQRQEVRQRSSAKDPKQMNWEI